VTSASAPYEVLIDRLGQCEDLVAELDAVIDAFSDGIFITDGRGRLLRDNRAYEEITGLTRDEVVDRNVEALLAAGRRFRFESVEELLLAVAAGGISPGQLLPRPEPAPPPEVGREGRGARPSGGAAAVRVDGVDNPLVRFARCCQPGPGDEIVGYVTRGRGVTIHRRDCANAVALRSDQARLMPVTWGAQAPGLPVELAVLGTDRPGLLAGVAQACSDLRINIYSAQAHSEPDGRAVVELVVEVRHLGELSRLEDRLERLPDVYSVVRRTRRERRRNGQRARS